MLREFLFVDSVLYLFYDLEIKPYFWVTDGISLDFEMA